MVRRKGEIGPVVFLLIGFILALMAKQFPHFNDRLTAFIAEQHLFFVATAPVAGRVNCSPKGMDSLKVIAPNRIIWLNVTGSGNETAAHILENRRMTLMWCAFNGAPLILRAYGTARAIYPIEQEWPELAARLPNLPGARQIYDMQVDMVQTSCGMAVPLMDFNEDRELLKDWARKKEQQDFLDYWELKNTTSIDGLPTGM